MNAISNTRLDGMMSVLNRVAAERQRYGLHTNITYSPDAIYASDGLAQTIIDKPAEDCMAAPFEIEGDENNDILNEFDRLDAIPVLTDCFRWARLHGGAVVLAFLDDGLLLTDPVNYDRINRVDDLIDYSAASMHVVDGQRFNDPTKKNYGWPSMYELRPKFGLSFMVHASRLIFIPGDPFPASLLTNQIMPWLGRSALDACYSDICRYKDGLLLTKQILERKVQLIHKMSDLGAMLAREEDEIVAKRIAIADAVRGVTRMVAVDALDDMILADTNLGGIDAVDKIFRTALCASSRLPQAILFSDQASGLNANAEGENSIYHSLLNGMRTRRLVPAIEQLAGFIWAQKTLGRAEPERWRVVLGPLFSPRPADLAEVKLKEAQARKTEMEAIQLGVDSFIMSGEEARQGMANAFPELNIDLTAPLPKIPDDPESGDDATSSVTSSGVAE